MGGCVNKKRLRNPFQLELAIYYKFGISCSFPFKAVMDFISLPELYLCLCFIVFDCYTVI